MRYKNLNRYVLFLAVLIISNVCRSQQHEVNGYVYDFNGKPLSEVIVYVKNNLNFITITDSIGFFKLSVNEQVFQSDTLVFSFMGYNTFSLPVRKSVEYNVINLKKSDILMQEVVVFRSKSMAGDFSTSSLKQLQIYTNPTSQADPLNAIQSLPISTNTLESATPMLRGSSGKLSRVFLNGVPVYYPTKGQQQNNTITSSSAFSTSLIKEEEIYASNPPIYYGNVSGGVIDMKLNNKLQNNKTLFLSMIGGGVAASLPFSKTRDDNFVDSYFNYTNLTPLKLVNNSMSNVNLYTSYDAGFHAQFKINQSVLSLYSSFSQEKGNYKSSVYSYNGEYKSNNLFNNNIINYNFPFGQNIIETNLSFSYLNNLMNYGNLDLDKKYYFIYGSMAYSRIFSNEIQIKLGWNVEYVDLNVDGTVPLYYYSYFPGTPSELLNLNSSFNKSEFFFFLKKRYRNFTSSIGTRLTYNKGKKLYFNYQLNLKYLSDNQRNKFLFSIGKYYSNDFMNEFYTYPVQNSFQCTFEYTYFTPRLQIQSALYKKHEEGYLDINYSSENRVDKQIWGAELMVRFQLSKNVSFQLSNLFLDSKIVNNNNEYRSYDDLNYFIKSLFSYDHPKNFSINVNFFLRPGTYYTPVINSVLNEDIDVYRPEYSNMMNQAQYNNYCTLNLNISKGFKNKLFSYSIFCSLNNILNRKNQSQVYYNKDYTTIFYDYFTPRILFIGCTIHFK
ncbi:TonB-dependent receptor [Culturomica massiliensis]|uniref:TonB-dependent receptor n=1 Tax=Culturomica massiliensis TaxID=1841857 RepID=UPI002665218C|nr:TonB-dependent receptor [Culturomica massiliensis]